MNITGRWLVMVRWIAVFMFSWVVIALGVRLLMPQLLGTTGLQSILVGVAIIGAAALVATFACRRQ